MMETETKCHVIIVAAGTGQRFGPGTGPPKQYQMIGDKTVLSHSIMVFDSLPIHDITVVLHPDDRHWSNHSHPSKHPITTTQGGAERHLSVLNGLNALNARDDDWVLVHDAARPCVSSHDISCLMDACQAHDQGGILATTVNDTIKFSKSGSQIEKTLDRSQLYAALTPQMFQYKPLVQALQKTQSSLSSDEASAMEQVGKYPQLIMGQRNNIKITTTEDLDMAKNILKQQGRL